MDNSILDNEQPANCQKYSDNNKCAHTNTNANTTAIKWRRKRRRRPNQLRGELERDREKQQNKHISVMKYDWVYAFFAV